MTEENQANQPEQVEEESKKLVKSSGNLLQFTPEKINAIKNTVAKGATSDELEMFMHLAQRYQLDPFSKEIWFIKRPKKQQDSSGNWDYKRLPNGDIDYAGVDPMIMTSRDGYLKVAQSDPAYEELNSLEIRKNDKFSYNPMTKEINHVLGADRGEITGAWAICRKKGREPAIAVVDFKEYKNAAGHKNSVWNNYPSAMIKKVAEVMVLKRQFNISGLLTEDEMPKQFSLEYEDPNLKRLEKKPDDHSVIDQTDEEYKAKQKQAWLEEMEKVKELMDQLEIDASKLSSIAIIEIGLDSEKKNWSINDVRAMIQHLEKKLAETTQND